jgi:hypothetical protein
VLNKMIIECMSQWRCCMLKTQNICRIFVSVNQDVAFLKYRKCAASMSVNGKAGC